MAIIYSYPTVTPSLNDLVLGTDVDNTGKATRNFTVQSIIDLVTVTGNNLQDVLNNGDTSVGRDIILGTAQDPTQTIYANTFNTGVASIVGGVGQNFTDFTSTRITGTLQTSAQTNITSIGTLINLKVGNATPAITSIVTAFTNPGDDIKLATTKAIVDYIGTKPNPETLAETLATGNVTGGTDIVVSAGDDITFTDTSKVILGTGTDATIEHDGTDLKIINTEGKTTISNSSGDIDISATAATKKLNLNGKTGVELQFDTGKRLETLTGGAKVTGTFEATGIGTLNGIVNTNSYTDSSGDTGTAGQVLSSTGVSGTNWIDDPNPTPYSWLVEADSGTGSPYTVLNGNTIHFKGDTNISTAWDNTNKEVLISLSGTSVTGSGVANQVTYWDGTQTITGAAGLTFAGGATGKVAIGGELEVGGVLTDGTFTGSSGTYTGFASISSTVFVGPLQGNADTATALVNAGTVSMSGDTVAAGVTYTSGGNVPLVSTISDSVVYNKVLSGFNAGSGSVQNGDSIIEALERLQGQVTNLPQGLVYQGVWSAAGTGGGTPDLTVAGTKVNGHFYICDTAGSAAPNGAGNPPNDWDVRDWVIFADDGAGGGVDEWQKIDNSSLAGGTGTPNTMTKWLTNQTIGNSNITDDGSIVTIADTINFTTQGNNTFGNTSADVSSFLGNVTLNENLILAKGLSLGSSYGTAGQVLTSGGGIGVANTWTTPTVGTVTSVVGISGITVTPLSGTPNPIVQPDYLGGNNIVLSAGAAVTPVGADTIIINDATTGNVVKALISGLPFNNYSWNLNVDGGTASTVSNGNEVDFLSGTGIIQSLSTRDVTTALRYSDENDDPATGDLNFIDATGTAVAPDEDDYLIFSDQFDTATKNVVKRAKIKDIIDLGNETLAEVLGNGNSSGGVKNIDMTGTVSNITLVDSGTSATPVVTQGRLQFGAGNDLSIYHDGTNSFIENVTGDLTISNTLDDITIAAKDEFLVKVKDTEIAIQAVADGKVGLRHNNVEKLATYSGGVDITGNINANDSLGSTISLARSVVPTAGNNTGRINFQGENFDSGNLETGASIVGSAEIDWASSVSTTKLIFQTKSGNALSTALEIKGNNDAEFTGNVEIDGNLTVDGSIIHGGGTSGGGTFSGDLDYTADTAATLFDLTRTTTGALIFDVFISMGVSSGGSTVKKFTVAHTFNTDPIFNLVLGSPGASGDSFTVEFTTVTNTTCRCIVTPSGGNASTISYTIMVGNDNSVLTFTPGT